jgi:hypothetical protein
MAELQRPADRTGGPSHVDAGSSANRDPATRPEQRSAGSCAGLAEPKRALQRRKRDPNDAPAARSATNSKTKPDLALAGSSAVTGMPHQTRTTLSRILRRARGTPKPEVQLGGTPLRASHLAAASLEHHPGRSATNSKTKPDLALAGSSAVTGMPHQTRTTLSRILRRARGAPKPEVQLGGTPLRASHLAARGQQPAAEGLRVTSP